MQTHTKPVDEVAIAAASLSRKAPDEWRLFLEALALYQNVQRDNLVKSPLAELPVNQGRAQLMGTLLGMLADCRTNAEKIANARKAKP